MLGLKSCTTNPRRVVCQVLSFCLPCEYEEAGQKDFYQAFWAVHSSPPHLLLSDEKQTTDDPGLRQCGEKGDEPGKPGAS